MSAQLTKLGKLLKERRKELGTTLRDVAGAVNISPAYLSIIEAAYNPKSKRPSRPSPEVLISLAQELGLPPQLLLTLAGYDALLVLGQKESVAHFRQDRGEEQISVSLIEEAQIALDTCRWSDAISKASFVRDELSEGNNVKVHIILAHAYVAENSWPMARESAKRALELDPLQPDLWHLLALTERQLGDPKAAVVALDRARALVALDDISTSLALLRERRDIMTEQRTWIEVLKTIDAELLLVPDDFERLALRANALERLGHEKEALTLLRRLTERPEATSDVWLARARLARVVDRDQDEAEKAFSSAQNLTSPTNPLLLQVRKQLDIPLKPESEGRLLELGYQVQIFENRKILVPPVCEVPMRSYLIGSDSAVDQMAYNNEKPQHLVAVDRFLIARYPVTVAEYACFVQDGGQIPDSYEWNGQVVNWDLQLRHLDYPVVCVDWFRAVAYASWLTKVTGNLWRLPTEVEWEAAARGTDGRIYPWGDKFDRNRCNTIASRIGSATPVGIYPDGQSPFGAYDMAGNVWEWTSSLFKLYPYDQSQENPNDPGQRILRGGSWNFIPNEARISDRDNTSPFDFNVDIGFRLVKSVGKAD